MSSALESTQSARVERSTTTLWLALGDVLVIAAFLGLGALRHNENPLALPLRFADTIAPFLIGWAIVAPLVGVYSPRARQSVRTAVLLTIGAWLGADIIGASLRATSFFHGNAPLSFVAVTFGVGGLFLGAWRAAVAYFLGN